MNIAVIGAGPAGAYFASYVKQRIPLTNVVIYEENTRHGQKGIGYGLDDAVVKYLSFIDNDPSNYSSIFTSVWNSSEVEAKDHVKNFRFPRNSGIRRAELLAYLLGIAEKCGVEIIYGAKIKPSDLDDLRQRFDVVVGADGLNSMVREHFKDEFRASAVFGTNSFSWLYGQRNRDFFRSVIKEVDGVVCLVTSYPIDDKLEAIIVDGQAAGLEASGLFGASDLERLSSELSTPARRIILEPQELRLRETRLNRCLRTSFDNVALIGDAGFSLHYKTGEGVMHAFETAKLLASLILTNPKDALQKYDEKSIGTNERAFAVSLRSMEWLNDIDRHYRTMDAEDLIEDFTFTRFEEPWLQF